MNTSPYRIVLSLPLLFVVIILAAVTAVPNSQAAFVENPGPQLTAQTTARPPGIDLNVTYISREPRYSRDAAKQWPDPGEFVTFTAHIVNKGTQPSGSFTYRWLIDDQEVAAGSILGLLPDEEITRIFQWPWQDGRHTVEFVADPDNLVAETFEQNNHIIDVTDALAVAFWVEDSVYNAHKEYSNSFGTYSWEDWAQEIIREMNRMFAESRFPDAPQGAEVRLRLDKITRVPDLTLQLCPDCNHAPDETITDVQWGFGKREGYHNPPPGGIYGINRPVIHELGHYLLSLVDLYGLDVDYWDVLVLDDHGQFIAGTPLMPLAAGSPEIVRYSSRTYDAMKLASAPFYSNHTIYGLNRTWPMGSRTPPGFGVYILDLPQETRLRILDGDEQPMPGVSVSVYQTIIGSDPFRYDQEFDNIPDFAGVTDAQGQFSLGRNPFPAEFKNPSGSGEIKLGLLLVKLEDPVSGAFGFTWVEVLEMNIACWLGDCELYIHDLYFPAGPRKLHVGEDHLSFQATRLQTEPLPQTIRVDYSGDPINHWSLSVPEVSWLRTIPDATYDRLYPAGPLTFIVDAAGLDPGIYTTAVQLTTWQDSSVPARTVTIELEVKNEPPQAAGEEYELPAAGTLTVAAPGVLANDSDPEDDPLTAVLMTDAQHGELTLDKDGSFTYTPYSGFYGSDSFQYQADDGYDSSAAATVQLTVKQRIIYLPAVLAP